MEARLVRQEELPDFLQVLDREDALPLPFRPDEEVPMHQLLEWIRQDRLRHADGCLQLRERPPFEREEFHEDLPRDILTQHGEDPSLRLDERAGDEVPLPMAVRLGLQDTVALEVSEVV